MSRPLKCCPDSLVNQPKTRPGQSDVVTISRLRNGVDRSSSCAVALNTVVLNTVAVNMWGVRSRIHGPTLSSPMRVRLAEAARLVAARPSAGVRDNRSVMPAQFPRGLARTPASSLAWSTHRRSTPRLPQVRIVTAPGAPGARPFVDLAQTLGARPSVLVLVRRPRRGLLSAPQVMVATMLLAAPLRGGPRPA